MSNEESLGNFKEYLYGFADLVYGTVKQDREIIDKFVKSQEELLSIIASLVYKYEDNGEVYISSEHLKKFEGKYFNLETNRDDDGGIHYKVEFIEEPSNEAESDSK